MDLWLYKKKLLMHEYSNISSRVFFSYSLIQTYHKCFLGLSYFFHICWHWFFSNGASWAKCVVKLWSPKPDPLDSLQFAKHFTSLTLSRCPPPTCPVSPRFSLMKTILRLQSCFAPKYRELEVPGYLHPLWVSFSWLGQMFGSLDPLTSIWTHFQSFLCRIRLKLGLYLKSYQVYVFSPSCPALSTFLTISKGRNYLIKYLYTNFMPEAASGCPSLTHTEFLKMPSLGKRLLA